MQYLISALTGEARDVVSSLDASEENYIEAWRMLKDRYDDDSLIIQKHVKALFEQPVLAKENHLALRRLLDNVLKHLRALKALERPTEQWDDLLLHLVTSRLDQTTNKEWETTIKKGQIPTFTQLTDFLAQRCRALEASSRTQRTALPTPKGGKDQNKGMAVHVATTNIMCAYCGKEDHSIYRCSEYLKLEVDRRIKEAKARKFCLNCLKAAAHQAKQYGSGSCRKCSKRHNTLLHLESSKQIESVAEPEGTSSPDKTKIASTSVNHATIDQERQVILATAIVNVLDARGKPKSCRALLDSGSQSCFITLGCVKRLGLKQHSTCLPITGLDQMSTQTRGLTKITLQSRINGFQSDLECLVVDAVTQALPVNRLDLHALQVPEGITLADPEFNQPSEVDLLLEAEIYTDCELLSTGRTRLAKDQPFWQKTLLGWIVTGIFTAADQSRKAVTCNFTVNEQLNANLTRFWQVEQTDRQNTRTPEERKYEGHFSRTYNRNADGRFIVALPTRQEELQNLGESRDIALHRFNILERKLGRNPQLKEE